MKTLGKCLISGTITVWLLMFGMTALATTTNITGIVEKKGGKYILLTVNDVYVLEGDEVPTDMVGKEITVTGTVETKDELKVMDVYIYEEVED